MEVSIFTRPEVTAELQKFVEVRLHTDKKYLKNLQEILEYRERLTGSDANPIYVILDPAKPDAPLARFDGADLRGGRRFREFLAKNAG